MSPGHTLAPTCDECWAVPANVEVDAGMFGYKNVCVSCYHDYYTPRPITHRYCDCHWTCDGPARCECECHLEVI